MSKEYFKETFSSENPLPDSIVDVLFENCLFSSYDFKHIKLVHAKFIDCTFKNCDLSNVSLATTRLRSCIFETCKILGVQWIHCSDFTSPSFNECNLSYGNFTGLNLKKNHFVNCSMMEADLSGADLSECNFSQCDFLNARFQDTNIMKANFQGAFNYLIDPIHNKVKGAKFSLPEAMGLLKGLGVIIAN
jgi:fluoroquinolone resistance protein